MNKTNIKTAFLCLPPVSTFFVAWWMWGIAFNKDTKRFVDLQYFALAGLIVSILSWLVWQVYPHSELVQFFNLGNFFLGIPVAMWKAANSLSFRILF
ncbi:hypothetical protein KTD15_06495 [Burkholderia multivorans]|uniref:hypothetical protein n=1 Tax=Burkholderia multivorans TaxID=87883 RepID=UPI001C2503CB|nr:hypothetical protein [Burkholderia multivorans]MBU9118444.1 hypothetical protein [Burkholderia multivorans]